MATEIKKVPDIFEASLDKALENDDVTTQELSDLRSQISCISDEDRAKMGAILERKITEKTKISIETKKSLRELLKDCSFQIEKKETKESSEMFNQVFDGTKSEMLSKEHTEGLKEYILTKFKKFDLSKDQKDNLATAVIDRLLSDKAFSGIVGDVSGKVTNVVDVLSKLTGDGKKEEAPKSEDSTKEEVETSTTGLMKRIGAIIDSATKPLVNLLDTKPAPSGLKGFLSNPRAIAEYDGSGEIRTNITEMSSQEKAEYVKNLNNRVLEIDGKIVPLETIREKGMDFVSTAPDWIQSILKWLLELPLIGNLLASFLGYKDGAEAIGGMGEELRQRRSIVTLRKLGKTTDAEGKEHEGKIDILKGVNLSKLNRKKLSKFFAFTLGKWVDSTTPDFWVRVLEKWEIVTKGTDGKEIVSHKIEPKIEAKDFEDDFKGLYEKLNGLQETAEVNETKEKNDAEKKEKADTEAKKQADLAAKKAEATKIQTELTPYKNIADGVIINIEVVEKLKNLTTTDFINGEYIKRAEKLLWNNPKKAEIIAVLSTFSVLLSSNEKVRTYIASLGTGPVNFKTLSYQRFSILAAAGYTSEYMKQQEGKVVEASKAQEEAKKQAEKADYVAKRDEAIVDWVSNASNFPVSLPKWDEAKINRGKALWIEYPTGVISFDANTEKLSIGEKQFFLKVKPFTKGLIEITDAKIVAIQVKDNDYFELVGKSERWGSGDPIKVKKTEMSELVIALLKGGADLPKFAENIAFISV